ncbi:MAG: glycosyltransferase [Lachnospiraceae bacterium]|nr:glycosyltransferase [Lachnospiraceae bacterium]
MKKGYYIHFNARTVPGVDKKIGMHLKAFKKRYDIEEINVEPVPRNLFERVIGLFPTASVSRTYKDALERIKDPDFIYARRTTCDRKYLGFFKAIKKKYPDCRIMIEIFTYPYDRDDFAKWDSWPFAIKEKMYRGKLKKYVDRFVTYTDDDEIFGIPTIKTVNGIYVSDIPIVKGDYDPDVINLIGVAYMQRQHGFERVIEGLGNYYSKDPGSKKRVNLTLVGDGPEKAKYIKLAEDLKIDEYVKFEPSTVGEALDELYDKNDIALGIFGMYKNGFYGCMSALKTRECLAKGLPTVSGCMIDVVPDDSEYALYFPNDGSEIDINKIVEYSDSLRDKYPHKKDLAEKIREFALETVDMDKVNEPIYGFIEA